MIRTDYSMNALLQENEVFDFDTVNVNETGINEDRMRLPERYDIAKEYKRYRRNKEKGKWVRKSKEEILDFSKDFDWQITYSFPNTLRNNSTGYVKYGGKNVTFRRLYLILCEHFNEGRFFIDDYFNSVYPYTIKPEIDEALDDVKFRLLDFADEYLEPYYNEEKGRFKKGGRAQLASYEAIARKFESEVSSVLAQRIKEDIISSLESGAIPLAFSLSESAQQKRIKAGLSPIPEFFATSQLINNLQLFLTLRGNGKWQTTQGITV